MVKLPLASVIQETSYRSAVTCPNCWHTFSPMDVLWIAVHPKLKGEPQLPESVLEGAQQRRFIPERFDVEGRAIDSEGAPCTELACPRCKLLVPRACLELPSLVFSVLGAPGSGKSVFLTSMTFSMRQHAVQLGLRFQDADVKLNRVLVDDERKMFLDSASEKYRAIDDAVKKTQTDDMRYRTSMLDGHPAKFVPPYTFLIGLSANHPQAEANNRVGRVLCLYDNAGEHFLPGADAADQPMTRHLAKSMGLIYTFDPTKDQRVRRKLGDKAGAGSAALRQDLVLVEAANRIREHAGLSRTAPIPQPLVVVLTKFDVWKPLLANFEETPLLRPFPDARFDVLDVDGVQDLSNLCRAFLWEHCRDIVSAAESVSDDVTYIPVAAVGWSVRSDPVTNMPQYQSADCTPYGVLIPLLTLMIKNVPQLCRTIRRAH